MRERSGETGALLVELHRGAWRADAPPLDVSLEDLVAVLPVLTSATP